MGLRPVRPNNQWVWSLRQEGIKGLRLMSFEIITFFEKNLTALSPAPIAWENLEVVPSISLRRSVPSSNSHMDSGWYNLNSNYGIISSCDSTYDPMIIEYINWNLINAWPQGYRKGKKKAKTNTSWYCFTYPSYNSNATPCNHLLINSLFSNFWSFIIGWSSSWLFLFISMFVTFD